VPALLALAAYPWLIAQANRLWLIALLMGLNGLLLYIPSVRRV
jgi:hypothetical protein